MSRVFFAKELDTAASWWRVYRRDGVTLGFTTHDRDLCFDGVLHRAAPGIVPSAIRRTAGFEDEDSDIQGALSHSDIRAQDLAAGRFDGARVETGIVDWETLESAALHTGSIGAVRQEADGFAAQMHSAKAELDTDPVPVTGPTCRAHFCGPGCGLNAAAFETVAVVTEIDNDTNRLKVDVADTARFEHGELRFLDGPPTGLAMRIVSIVDGAIGFDRVLDEDVLPGMRVRLREGCDRTIATCAGRFANADNFRGEPFLPGNDLLAQYPVPR